MTRNNSNKASVRILMRVYINGMHQGFSPPRTVHATLTAALKSFQAQLEEAQKYGKGQPIEQFPHGGVAYLWLRRPDLEPTHQVVIVDGKPHISSL